jgi:hypothetical protein
MAYDPVRAVTVLFGGYDDNAGSTAQTWEWNGTVWTQRGVSGPPPRRQFAMIYDVARGATVLFGGTISDPGSGNTTTSGDTWEWDGALWVQGPVNGPAPRTLHAMGYDAAHASVVLFGGGEAYHFGSIQMITGETWTLNSPCGSADFNGDGSVGTDADILDFFSCLSGFCCPACGSADFNGDGDVGTDADIEAFFRVLAGGSC